MRSKRVILDTNLWISFLISNNFSRIDDLILDRLIQIVFSEELITEFVTVAQRPRLSKYFSSESIYELLQLFKIYGIIINVKSKVDICRDKKDNFLLNLAIDSNADYLVTGDFDLLVLKSIKKTKILTWQEFLSAIQ